MRIEILTLFPGMCDRVMNESIIGRARKNGLYDLHCRNIRDYAGNNQARVDDYPYGGGSGMVMQAQPLAACFEAACENFPETPHLIYMTPQGKPLTQQRIRELSELPGLCILCGHYEGIDERFIDEFQPEEISVGDFVVTGGELPALMLADAVIRLLPGVLSDPSCFIEESHYDGLLEYPHYSRPQSWRGREVPEILLSGHHANIQDWREEQSLQRTRRKRPDLLPEIRIHLTRDSVCMADDVNDYTETISTIPRRSVHTALMMIAKDYLPLVAGHDHTWNCFLNGERIALIKGNCAKIKCFPTSSVISDGSCLYFKYRPAAFKSNGSR